MKTGTRIEQGVGDRLALQSYDLHCGDDIELMVAGRWVPGRVEKDERWYAGVYQQRGVHGELSVALHPGLIARWPKR